MKIFNRKYINSAVSKHRNTIVAFVIYFSISFLAITFPLLLFYREMPTVDTLVKTMGQVGFSTFLISFITFGTGFLTYNMNKQTKYNNLITKSRLDWLKEVRNLTTEFIEYTVDQYNLRQKKEPGEKEKHQMYANSPKIKSLNNKLILYFNPNEKKAVEIIDIIKEITAYVSTDNGKVEKEGFGSLQMKFVELMSQYFKEVWDEIKNEAR